MRFGRWEVSEGLLLAHTLRLSDGAVFKKGRCLDREDVERLHRDGIAWVWAAQLDPHDLDEDRAAAQLARTVAGSGTRPAEASTGRCNLHAEVSGLLVLAVDAVKSLNHLSPDLTLATLPPFSVVRAGTMVATIKVIPFAVPESLLDSAQSLARSSVPEAVSLIRVVPFVPRRLGLILTRTAGLPESILDRAAAAQRVRAERLGSVISDERRCAHDQESVAAAVGELAACGCSPILVLGASAIVDRRDVIPSAIEQAGGEVVHLGMPVDPGNLLLLGRLGEVSVLGVPGCARSLRRSGFDFVLERLCAGISVSAGDIMDLGVGGLLHEVPWRPAPRAQPVLPPQVAAVVLAAGRSQRMQDRNKLLELLEGKPLVCHVVDELLQTAVRPIVVVTGHQAEQVRAALADRQVVFVHNPDFAAGLSSSLRMGLGQLDSSIDGALICLGDMPRVRAKHIEALLGAFEPEDGREVVLPTFGGRRGNPVLWAARFFPAMRELSGDVGARDLLNRYSASICPVPMADDGITLDVDTPAALRALTQRRAEP